MLGENDVLVEINNLLIESNIHHFRQLIISFCILMVVGIDKWNFSIRERTRKKLEGIARGGRNLKKQRIWKETGKACKDLADRLSLELNDAFCT